MTLHRLWYLALGLLLLGAFVHAEGPTNPSTIEFAHADFAAIDHYVIGYFSDVDAVAPVQEVDLPKPATCAPCSGPLASRPAAFQTWYVAVRAVAGTVRSPWSEKVPFVRAPLSPASVRVR